VGKDDINGTGLWGDYQTFRRTRGDTFTHEFQPGFSANWIRAFSDQEAIATVWFVYE
jgi:hypothetical protein